MVIIAPTGITMFVQMHHLMSSGNSPCDQPNYRTALTADDTLFRAEAEKDRAYHAPGMLPVEAPAHRHTITRGNTMWACPKGNSTSVAFSSILLPHCITCGLDDEPETETKVGIFGFEASQPQNITYLCS